MGRTHTKRKAAPPKRSRPRTLRVAFIGAGPRATSSHYASIRDIQGAAICGIAELDEERMKKAAATFGVKASALYTDYRQMIEREKPDVVYAIMKPHLLFEVAATVMEMGCHLVVEKPPAVTCEQTRQLAIIARKNKVLTAVTFQRRFAPVIAAGKKACEARGPIHTAVATFYKCAVGAGPYYNGAMDILTCDAIHAVDTLRFLCGGEVVRVASDVRRLGAEHWTVHNALVRFDDPKRPKRKITGVLLTNWMTGRRFFTVEAHARGISFFGDPEEGGRVFADGKVEPLMELDPEKLSGSAENYIACGPLDLNRYLISCIRRRRQPSVSFDDAVKTMELIEAIYQHRIGPEPPSEVQPL